MEVKPGPVRAFVRSCCEGLKRRFRGNIIERPVPIEALETRVHLSSAKLSSGVSANIALTSDTSVQQNPSIATDPTNPKHLVVSYLDYSLLTTGYAGIGIAVSEDGGKTFTDTQIPLPANFDQGAGTPVTQFDAQGNVFVSFSAATFLGTLPGLSDPDYSDRQAGDGFTSNNGIFVAEGTDGGMHWNTPVAVVSHLYDGTDPVDFEVTPDLAIDTFAKLPDGKTNPNYDDMYEVWTRNYTPGTFPGEPTFTGGTDGMIAVSKDHGQTWQIEADKNGVTAIDDPVRNLSDGGPGEGYVDQVHVTVGPEGDVYVADYGGGDFSVLTSTDGGQTFAAPDHNTNERLAFGDGFNAFSNSNLENDQFRMNSLRDIVADPTRPGVVYAVDVIAGSSDQADVFFARSSDYGVTWTSTFNVGGVPATVLNDDAGLNDGHAMARLQVAPNGDLAVIWYDTRVDAANTALNVFATVSTDGGANWSANFRISDSTFDPNAGVFTDAAGNQNYYLGDFIGLILTDTTAYATWTDTRNGNQDIEFASFALSPAPAALDDRFEPNNTVAQATALGTVYTTTVPELDITSGDTDWYSFTPSAAGQMSLEAIQPAAASAQLQFELYDSTGGTLLATGTSVKNSAGSVVGVQISAPGVSGTTYLLRVVPVGSGTTYSLQLQGLTENLGTQVYGQESNVLVAGEVNDYLVTAPAAGTLNVDLSPASDATGTFALNVLSFDGSSTLATGTASGNDQTATLAVTAGQQVLLEVSGDDTTAGSYGLTFSDLDQNTVAASSTLIPAGSDPSQEVVSDLTGDGKQDIVVSEANTDTIDVLMNNGNGTFQAPQEYTVGPFGSTARLTSGTLPNFRRAIAVADFNGDGIPDIVVTNYASGDVSVLLGNGDGTFQPQRRFNAVPDPFDLAVGDLTGNGISDIVTVSANTTAGLNLLQQTVGVLLGRGDGTFLPPKTFTIDLPAGDEYPLSSLQIADINGDGIPDLLVSGGSDSKIRIFYGKGDGTFTAGPVITGAQEGAALTAANLSGGNNADIISASLNTGALTVYQSDNNGKFTSFPSLGSIGAGPIAFAVGDFASENSDGSLGPADGVPDLIVANSGVTFGLPNSYTAGVSVLPGVAPGDFEGFNYPDQVYSGIAPQDVAVGDFNDDGATDIAVTDVDGVHIIYGGTPTLTANDTPQTALDLGAVTHVVEPTLSIVPGNEDAYFDLTAPVEANSAAGDEVLDFSGLFQHQIGQGLTMELLNSSGQVVASGERFRVDVAQGEALTLHVEGGSSTAAGAYTLDIDALPQVVSVAAESALPGTGSSAGAASNIVIAFQGDRLDAATAENPANYQVIYLGADGVPGTNDDQAIPLASGQSVIYDPGANLDVTTGKVYPTAVKQTVTLLFDQVLPAGNYEIKLSSNIQSANTIANESDLLASSGTITGHPLVSVVNASVIEGAKLVSNLDTSSTSTDDVADFKSGTPFLSQLHSDLNAMLDSELSASGDNSSITPALLAQLMQRFAPELSGHGLPPLLVLFLDPVSLNLADPSGNHVSYNLQTNALSNQSSDAFVSVTGNVELVVMPLLNGTYNLDVSDVPQTARGGAEILGAQSQQTIAITDQLRDGQQDFSFGSNADGSATEFLNEANQRSDYFTSTKSASDQSAEAETPVGSSNTTTETSSDEHASAPATSEDAVALSGEAMTVDGGQGSGQNQANQKKRHPHPGDGQAPNALPGPTSKPARRGHPTTGVATVEPEPTIPQTAKGNAAMTAEKVDATKADATNVDAGKPEKPPATRVVADSSVRAKRSRVGTVALAVFTAGGLLEMIGGKKMRSATRRPRRRE
jgi:hypothetical protein